MRFHGPGGSWCPGPYAEGTRRRPSLGRQEARRCILSASRLAALLFHHDLALYDEMWGGDQQGFFAFYGAIGYLVNGDLAPQWVRQLRAMNGYVEAEPVLAAIAADPYASATLRAKALYSATRTRTPPCRRACCGRRS